MKSSGRLKQSMPDKASAYFRDHMHKESLTPAAVRRFRGIIYRYYRDNARRSLPWRNTDNPYHILVSEIMLQQTQIERVLNRYPLFITRFPGFRSLARARPRSLYTVWQGMGYNRRALALKEIARIVVRPPYHGKLPPDKDELMTLPFVGQSTAGAVAAFAFHQPVVFIETNIRRVFIHLFFHKQEKVTDSDILPFIERTLDRKDPRRWYYALMDYGSALRSLSVNPNLKSANYKKQGAFAGSNRQMRGKILRMISERPDMRVKDLAEKVNASPDKIGGIIDELCREGFIKKKGHSITMG